METSDKKKGSKKPVAEKKELTITPLFDEEGNLMETIPDSILQKQIEEEKDEDSPEQLHIETGTPETTGEIAAEPDTSSENNTGAESGAVIKTETEISPPYNQTSELSDSETAETEQAEKEAAISQEVSEIVINDKQDPTGARAAEIVADEDQDTPETEISEFDAVGDKDIPEAGVAEIVADGDQDIPEAGVAEIVPDENQDTPETEVTEIVADEDQDTPETEISEIDAVGDKDTPEAEAAEIVAEEVQDAPEAGAAVIIADEDQVTPETEVTEIVEDETKDTIEAGIPESTEDTISETAEDDPSDPSESDHEHESEDLEEIEDFADYSSFGKEELIQSMEELVSNENVMLFRQKAGKLKLAYFELLKSEKEDALKAFLAEGGDQNDFSFTPDELNLRFEAALNLYKGKKQQHLEKLEEIKKENLVKKLDMLEKIKELINSEEPLKKTYDEFRSIQDKWREIGNVPKNEISNLWQSYHFLVEKFFDKVKINNELRDLDMKKNLEKKIELCEKAEELLLETSVIKSFKQLQKYHQEWKDIGAVPHDKKDELWERFKDTTEKINERRREYYEQLHQEQENNWAAKKALCERAEDILATLPESMGDWQKSTEEINELMKMWRSLGPAPRQYNDEIWKRFKSLVNEYYNQKKSHYTSVKDEQINNYNMKLDICQQAEALKDSTDWRETTEALIRLQQEWKKIGPVPRRNADKIWKRFRSACDCFFEKKQAHFSSQKESEDENLKIKEGLIEKIRQLEVTSNKEEALNTIKDIQRQFIETGHVPFRKKNEIHTTFREAINEKLDQLKISHAEISLNTYRPRGETRFERGDRQARGQNKENINLQNKISKLKNDIALWENNIGFLASSAAAEVLKSEFEKKIERTKEEIILLETKLKMLQQ